MENKERRSSVLTAAAAVAIIVLGVLLIICLSKINRLSDELTNLRMSINNTRYQISYLQSEISSIYENVDDHLKKEASLLSDVSYEFGELDTDTHKVSFNLKVVPKKLTDDMKLTVNIGAESFELVKQGNEFFAQAKVSIFNSKDENPILYIATADGIETEKLDSVYLKDLYNNYLPYLSCDFPFANFEKGKLTIDGAINVYFAKSGTDNISIDKCEVIAEINGKEADRKDISSEVRFNDYFGEFYGSYKLNDGDKFSLYILAEDSLGYTHKTVVYQFVRNENEDGDTQVEAIGYGDIIYDKDGNLLTGNEK